MESHKYVVEVERTALHGGRILEAMINDVRAYAEREIQDLQVRVKQLEDALARMNTETNE